MVGHLGVGPNLDQGLTDERAYLTKDGLPKISQGVKNSQVGM